MYKRQTVVFNLNNKIHEELYQWCSEQSENFSDFARTVLLMYKEEKERELVSRERETQETLAKEMQKKLDVAQNSNNLTVDMVNNLVTNQLSGMLSQLTKDIATMVHNETKVENRKTVEVQQPKQPIGKELQNVEGVDIQVGSKKKGFIL